MKVSLCHPMVTVLFICFFSQLQSADKILSQIQFSKSKSSDWYAQTEKAAAPSHNTASFMPTTNVAIVNTLAWWNLNQKPCIVFYQEVLRIRPLSLKTAHIIHKKNSLETHYNQLYAYVLKVKKAADEKAEEQQARALKKENEKSQFSISLQKLCNTNNLTKEQIAKFTQTHKKKLALYRENPIVQLILKGVQKGMHYDYEAVALLRVLLKKPHEYETYLQPGALQELRLDLHGEILENAYRLQLDYKDFFFNDIQQEKKNIALGEACRLWNRFFKNKVATTDYDYYIASLQDDFLKNVAHLTTDKPRIAQRLCKTYTTLQQIYTMRNSEEVKTVLIDTAAQVVEHGVVPGFEEAYMDALAVATMTQTPQERIHAINNIPKNAYSSDHLRAYYHFGICRMYPFQKDTFELIRTSLDVLEIEKKSLAQNEKRFGMVHAIDWLRGQLLLAEGKEAQAQHSFMDALKGSVTRTFYYISDAATLNFLKQKANELALKKSYELSLEEKRWLYIYMRSKLIIDPSDQRLRQLKEKLIQSKNPEALLHALNNDMYALSKEYGLMRQYLTLLHDISLDDNVLKQRTFNHIKTLIERDDASFDLWVHAIPFAKGEYRDALINLLIEKEFKITHEDIALIGGLEEADFNVIAEVLNKSKYIGEAVVLLLQSYRCLRECIAKSEKEDAIESNQFITLYKRFNALVYDAQNNKKCDQRSFKSIADYVRANLVRCAYMHGNLFTDKNNRYECYTIAVQNNFYNAVHSLYTLLKGENTNETYTKIEKSSRFEDVFFRYSIAQAIYNQRLINQAPTNRSKLVFIKPEIENSFITSFEHLVTSSQFDFWKSFFDNQESIVKEWAYFLQTISVQSIDMPTVWRSIDQRFSEGAKNRSWHDKAVLGIVSRILAGIEIDEKKRYTFTLDEMHSYCDCYYNNNPLRETQREMLKDVNSVIERQWVFMGMLMKDLTALLTNADDYKIYDRLLERIYVALQYHGDVWQAGVKEYGQQYEIPMKIIQKIEKELCNARKNTFEKEGIVESALGKFRVDIFPHLRKSIYNAIKAQANKHSKKIIKKKKII